MWGTLKDYTFLQLKNVLQDELLKITETYKDDLMRMSNSLENTECVCVYVCVFHFLHAELFEG